MTNPSERRVHKRFAVEGSFTKVQDESFQVESATAKIKHGGLIGALSGYSKKQYKVLNLSRGGLAFESEEPFKFDQKISMLLYIPGLKEPLELTGRVRWQKDLFVKYVLKTVGIQFEPFGDKKGMNQESALDVLVELEERYAPSDQDDS